MHWLLAATIGGTILCVAFAAVAIVAHRAAMYAVQHAAKTGAPIDVLGRPHYVFDATDPESWKLDKPAPVFPIRPKSGVTP